ncbi:MAG: hypothetical protein K5829_01860 [Treponema sp.]|nr:hypothetical protein [Treponema sp.]
MKKTKFILGVIAAASMLFAMTGCDLTIRDTYIPPEVEGITIGLGGENTFNVSKVNVNGTVDASLANSALAPSAWNSITQFIQVEIEEGQYVEYTFTQPEQGSNSWNSWALAIFDDNNYGNFLRADNWLNSSTDATFVGGKWVAGGSSANGTWSNGYTYETVGSQLPTDATVVLRVEYDGTNVTVTETVNGTEAYTTSSSNW